jgi:hypothetical protein
MGETAADGAGGKDEKRRQNDNTVRRETRETPPIRHAHGDKTGANCRVGDYRHFGGNK